MSCRFQQRYVGLDLGTTDSNRPDLKAVNHLISNRGQLTWEYKRQTEQETERVRVMIYFHKVQTERNYKYFSHYTKTV